MFCFFRAFHLPIECLFHFTIGNLSAECLLFSSSLKTSKMDICLLQSGELGKLQAEKQF